MKAIANIVLGLAVVGVSASATQAVIVTDGVSTTLFQDNFEGGTDGSPPVAQIGTWSKSGSPMVESNTTPPAYEGNKYLQITRPAASFADFGKQTSGTLHSEFMLYIRSANFASHGAQVLLRDDALSGYGIILSAISGGSVYYYNGSGYSASNATFALDTWQKWTLDVDLSTDTYNFSVNGTQGLSTPDTIHDSVSDLRYMIFGSGGGTNPQYLVDAVPEPASVGLIGLTCMGLLGSRRRR
ncbi:MAG: PEP-CTERM sorting domain-containing protein [Phycisphaerales bacterium]|jgi:hypothetical protein|nr:PEP-CTERM sorting domain-containing protein [Phycisphaerales bacterium]